MVCISLFLKWVLVTKFLISFHIFLREKLIFCLKFCVNGML